MKKSKLEKIFLGVLEKTCNISVAAEKVGLSRQTIYRWMREDLKFSKKVTSSLFIGNEFLADLADSQLILAVKKGEPWAIKLILSHRHSKYKKIPDPIGKKGEGLAKIKFVTYRSKEELDESRKLEAEIRDLRDQLELHQKS